MWLFLIGAIVALTLVLYNSSQKMKYYWKKHGVKFITPCPIFGNFGASFTVRRSYAETLKKLYDQFPNERYIGVFMARRPAVMLRDPELVKDVLVKDFAHFTNRTSSTTDTRREPLLRNLANMSGEEWRSLRQVVTPTFSAAKLRAMFQLVDQSAKELVATVHQLEALDLPDITARYATDVIGRCAFGIDTSSLRDPESPFRKMGRKMFRADAATILRRYCRIYVPYLFRALNMRSYSEDIEKFFTSIVSQVLEDRRRSGIPRNDFIQLLLNERSGIDESLIASNSFMFLLAGLETSSTTMSFCLYEMAHNLEVQERARQEIKECTQKFGGITYEAVNAMSYVGNSVQETLRKHPPTPLVTRMCTKQYKFSQSDLSLEVGDAVLIPIYAIHHDQAHYPEPQIFNPDRFAGDNQQSGIFLSLGDGPRNCVGGRFANLMMVCGLAAILSEFTVLPCEKTSPTVKYDPRSVMLKNKGGLWVRLQPTKATKQD